MRVHDGLLHVHYGQAYLVSDEDFDTSEMDACFRGQANGLLGAAQGGWLFMLTGLHTGSVRLTIDVLDDEPGLDDAWEECVEVSLAPRASDVRLVAWGGEVVCRFELSETDYRVRYAARGMDAGNAADTIVEGEEHVDAYWLSLWPAAPAPDRVIKQTSDIAAYWHTWAREL